MRSTLDTYLGWETLRHFDGCKRPLVKIAWRRDENEYRRDPDRGFGGSSVNHSCTTEYCAHGNSFTKLTVRIVCITCTAAQVITGEATEDTGISTTTTKHLGYGLAPRQAAGLLLWPGMPWIDVGRMGSEEPHDFVVTRTGVKTVTQDVVVGQITQGRGKLGGLVWTALAVPDPEGRYGFGRPVHYMHRNDGRGDGGSPLRTVKSAARWVAARLAEHGAQGGGAK
ncbi:hypothetical protein OG866_26950 [Streptomyces sp. NBC_00663]|uniref:hypothetical protein n=1 Tax=Streptomyces sp. NBC_00663 TaxID=2975801 RepID=UPI002E307895|nr:hypothetical protein [Streptomyces sp. NBC_00663]